MSEDKCIEEEACIAALAKDIDDLLASIQSRYRAYGIDREPRVFIKNDRGTYGLGILTLSSGSEFRSLSNRRRNRLMHTSCWGLLRELPDPRGRADAARVRGKDPRTSGLPRGWRGGLMVLQSQLEEGGCGQSEFTFFQVPQQGGAWGGFRTTRPGTRSPCTRLRARHVGDGKGTRATSQCSIMNRSHPRERLNLHPCPRSHNSKGRGPPPSLRS